MLSQSISSRSFLGRGSGYARRIATSLVELLVILSILSILGGMTIALLSAGVRFAINLEARANSAKKLAGRNQPRSVFHNMGRPIADHYIVVLRDEVDAEHESRRLSQVLSVEVRQVYTHVFQGFAARISAAALPALLADPAVRHVEQDQTLLLAAASVAQGRQRINALRPVGRTQAVDADIAVIDTGVDPANTSLDVVHQQGFGTNDSRDTDGHGTQVASVIAARENDTGVTGVAPGARIWALKVANASGSGSASNLISALDFVTARADRIDVANISVLTGRPSLTVNLAASACVRAGVVVVVAAGNSKRDVSAFSPANEPGVITVAALADSDGQLGGTGASTSDGDADDTLASSFSNYGELVDFLAPGTGIYAIDLANGLSRVSGTSFAAAHVSGVAALLQSGRHAARDAFATSLDVRSLLEAATRESIPGPGRHRPYPVVNAGFASMPAASPQTPTTPMLPSLPLSFEVNAGQTHPQVRYLTRAKNYTAFLTAQGFVVSMQDGRAVQRIQFASANLQPRLAGLSRLPGIVNYFIGADAAKWLTNIPTFSSVVCDELYRGIDLLYYSDESRLRYDLIVAPGADPSQITLDFPDASMLKVERSGQLLVTLPGGGDFLQSAPILYQQGATGRESIRGRYVKVGDRRVRFEIGEYDYRRPLIIDPYIMNTYAGGSAVDRINGLAVDAAGNAYVTGQSLSLDFPIMGGFQSTKGTSNDVVVAKYNAAGTALLYSTYVGGPANDIGNDIAVDAAGNAFVAGTITGAPVLPSGAFPTTPGSFETASWATQNVIVFKLNAAGNALIWSAIPNTGPGIESGEGIAIDAAGNAYITGYCTNSTHSMTATPGAYQTFVNGGMDAYVMKINPTGSAQIYLTYIGGAGSDTGRAIAVDAAGNAYVVGETRSANFPVTGGIQPAFGGGDDAFVAKFDPTGASLLYSTYLGGSGADDANGIAVDAAGNAYVVGFTAGGFPVIPGAFQVGYQGGSSDAFVTKINATGAALLYSTYLGSYALDTGNDVVIDGAGVAYVIGETRSNLFPNVSPVQLPWPSGGDAFVAALNPAGSALVFASHIGGSGSEVGNSIALGAGGSLWLAGDTNSTNFPTLNPLQPALGGSQDGFVVRLTTGGAPIPGVSIIQSGGSTDVAEGGATDTYSVVLTTPPFFNVNISVSSGPQLTVAPTALAFTAVNWNTPQTITVTAIDDSVGEGLHTGTITHTVSSSDVNYNSIAVASVIANITDNDFPGVTITQSGGSTDVAEGGATDSYAVVLKSLPTANVTVDINSGLQLNVAPASIIFTPTNWNTPRTVTVTAVDDALIEGPHSGVITHTAVSADAAYNGLAVASITANITDNDFLVGVTVVESGGSTNVTEGGATDSYSVALVSAPSANVTITITPDAQVTRAPATLTFTTTNWNMPQTVTVTAVDDSLVEQNPHIGVIKHAAMSADAKYNGIAIADVNAIIAENDFPPPDAADTSELATFMGALSGVKTFKGLDTFRHPGGKFDDDWYAWTMSKSGTFTMNLNNIKVVSSGPKGQFTFGDLHCRVYRISNGNLVQLGSSQDSGSKVVSVPVNQGERILVWVYGLFFTQATYDFSVDVK